MKKSEKAMILFTALNLITTLSASSETKNATLQLIMNQDFFNNVHTNLALPLVKHLPNISLGELSLDFDLGILKLASNLTKLSFNYTDYD